MPRSAQEIYDGLKAYLLQRTSQRGMRSFRDTGVLGGLLWAFAQEQAKVELAMEALARRYYLDTAEGADLDRLAEDHYGLRRRPATHATGYALLYFNRPVEQPLLLPASGYQVDPEVGGIVSVEPGMRAADRRAERVFALMPPAAAADRVEVELPAGTQVAVLRWVSLQKGSQGNVGPYTLSRLLDVTAPGGFVAHPVSLKDLPIFGAAGELYPDPARDGPEYPQRLAELRGRVYDPDGMARLETGELFAQVNFGGGSDAEGDEAYRSRVREYLSTLSRATEASLKQAVEAIPSVRRASVVTGGSGRAYVYVDPEGDSLQPAVKAAVEAAVEQYRPAGVLPVVLVPKRKAVYAYAALTYEGASAADRSRIQQQARSMIVEYINSLEMGQSVIASRIVDRLMSLPGVRSVDRLHLDTYPSRGGNRMGELVAYARTFLSGNYVRSRPLSELTARELAARAYVVEDVGGVQHAVYLEPEGVVRYADRLEPVIYALTRDLDAEANVVPYSAGVWVD